MTPHDLWLEPDDEPDEDETEDTPVCKGCGDCHSRRHKCQAETDYERDTDAFMEGDWGSDERDRLVEKNYDR